MPNKRVMKGLCTAIMFLLTSCCGIASLRAQSESHNALNEAAPVDSAPSRKSSGNAGYAVRRGTNEFGAWGGVSFQATTVFGGVREDEARGRKLLIAAFRYGRTLAANDSVALQYTLDVIPLAVQTNNIAQQTTVITPTGSSTTFRRKTSYGGGLTPLGLQLDLRNSARVKPFVQVNAGGLLFTESVPLPEAGKFAFTLGGGAGVRIFESAQRAVTLGVRLHHISNANRSGANRGLNQFVFYAGVSVFK